MIRIFLGNVGSGKTLTAISEIVEDDTIYFSNIKTKSRGKFKVDNNNVINRDMIVKKELQKVKTTGEEVYKYKFNKEYWQKMKAKYHSFDIVLDEFHSLMEARGFQSKQNRILGDFLALIRKISSDSQHDSTLTLISQLDNRIDVIARQMATEVRYHVCIYDKICKKCGAYWTEHSEMPPFEKIKKCENCGSKLLRKDNHKVIAHFFDSMNSYQNWRYNKIETQIQTIMYENLSQFFKYYDTDQTDDLVSED